MYYYRRRRHHHPSSIVIVIIIIIIIHLSSPKQKIDTNKYINIRISIHTVQHAKNKTDRTEIQYAQNCNIRERGDERLERWTCMESLRAETSMERHVVAVNSVRVWLLSRLVQSGISCARKMLYS